MRLILSCTLILVIAGCSIQDNRADYEYPAGSDGSGTDWPELSVTSELRDAGTAVQTRAADNQTEADRLAARARALRARAARLRQQVGN